MPTSLLYDVQAITDDRAREIGATAGVTNRKQMDEQTQRLREGFVDVFTLLDNEVVETANGLWAARVVLLQEAP